MSRHGSRPRRPHGGGPAGRRAGRPRTARDRRRRELGQNLLVDPLAVARVVEAADVRADDLVVDLGAGRGALTGPLRGAGARVVAIELDRDLAADLRRAHGDDPHVRIVVGDALTVPLPTEPFRVVANPPYGRSTAILRRLLGAAVPFGDATLLLQHQTARRVGGSHGVGALHLAWVPWFTFDVVAEVPRVAFRPVPDVDSAILRVTRRPTPSLSPVRCADWQGFVDRVFRAPGRTAADRLAATLGATAAARAADRAGVRTVRPPSKVTADDWIAIYRATVT